MSLFHRETERERQRREKRGLQHNQRDLDKEVASLEREEKKITAEIKRYARAGQMDVAKQLAVEVGRIRSRKVQILKMRGQASRQSQISSHATMAKSLGQATSVMQRMNDQLKVEDVMRTAQQFSKASDQLDLKEDIMNDALDAMDGDGMEEEVSAEVAGVLEELGVELGSELDKYNAPDWLPEDDALQSRVRELESAK